MKQFDRLHTMVKVTIITLVCAALGVAVAVLLGLQPEWASRIMLGSLAIVALLLEHDCRKLRRKL